MKKIILTASLCLCAVLVHAQAKKTMRQLIAENLSLAEKQYTYLSRQVPANDMPRTYQDGKSINSNMVWWTSGFYPGTLLYIYEYTKSPAMLAEAERRMKNLEAEKTDTIDHDLGFKMFCSFGNAYRLTKKQHDKDVVMAASNSLSMRYRPSIKSIQSWNKSEKFNCPVIIDNMMNLEMLEWAAHNGGSARLGAIAVNHANTTLENHFRKNYSSYHVVDYDLSTGKVLKKKTAQGAADSSAWSRGQGWAMYGFTMMYRFTHDARYLKQARGVAQFIIHNPTLPADKVPYWDFDAPGIPNTLRDVSAAAVYASALLELGQYTTGAEKRSYIDVAKTILYSLSTDAYRAKLGENGGFLLKHSVGSIPHKTEVDVPLTYADYYFIEALLRYKKWYL
ncbi:glycosyl hydrolase family 88 [Mucilaginibacter gracilis]|uniref:Glycosyl hydrolase family 88 n=1 Tax=Mucilaginibacter gracilis TaxID=423350 RepID=A0A495IT84_9SPHI|nr:glycoside hydrolase family 88 protein [Mucilaginibacter gracilis]RKR79967.1 glycosyl hydrolase family 88 [Mucilaginibacter gracilis]